ncbi:neuronal-specific septin-3 isoform X1 [Elephas maximus indicus]|uniref:neuronal-specific septin-3 isoform X1 n=1 Tax=Elephas maximus indicus TaxID=99487 RepID=UPI002116908F|nr:neuronal-specific septin-3 isoform X1 [Elephas maximus indicus]
MDHDFAPAPPEMQPHGAPGPGASFSHSHLLGRSARPSRLPGGVPPLIPVLRKTICLDAFPQSHIPQASRRPGLGSKARSVAPQEIGIAPGTAPGNSPVPRKLSSISLTLRQNSQARPQDPYPSHWEEVPTPDRKVATHGGGRLLTPGSPPMTLVPGDRVHSQHPGSPGLAKPIRVPTVEKPLVSSYLTLPFQSRLTRSPPGPAGPGPVGQGHPVPMTAHMPTKASQGRGKPRPRGIPRSRLHLQRATPTLGPVTALDLATLDTRPDTARHLATMANNRPSLAINLDSPNTARLNIGTCTEFPVLDTKLGIAMDLTTAGTAKSRKVMNVATAGTTKPGAAMNLTSIGKTKLGISKATAGTAKPDTITGRTAMALATPDPVNLGSAMNMAAAGTAKLGTAMDLARVNTAKLGITMDSPVLDTVNLDIAMNSVVLVSPDPGNGGATLDSVINLTTSDIATYPLMTNRIIDLPLDHTRADAATDPATESAIPDLARKAKWLPETRTDTAMSELVPEPRPKPAVPMKPVSINSNLLGYIGIDTIIEQMRKKTMKTGFDFNIMVVGQSGLGKSTLVNTLFKSQVSRKATSWNREEKIPKTVEIKAIGHVIEEGGVKMKLTVIDTPGFGDQINNENCWEPIEKYINEQYEKFLKEEVNIARKKRIPDTRVHCCLYFISPTGHSLRPLDVEFMKHLSKVVNIIPVIAKADTMTLEEKSEFKQRVRKELEVNGIEFYPQKEFDEDLEDKTENDKIRQESMPFAVVGSDKEYQVNGKRVLGRKTPWGIIEVENLNHCEFALLRDFVIRTHLQDLKEVTHNIHYETYRAKRLNDNGGLPPGEGLLGTVLPPVPATPCPTAE